MLSTSVVCSRLHISGSPVYSKLAKSEERDTVLMSQWAKIYHLKSKWKNTNWQKKGLYFFEIFHQMSINCNKYHIDWKSLDVWYIICTLHICTLHIYNLWHKDSVRLMRDCFVAAKLSDWDWQS